MRMPKPGLLVHPNRCMPEGDTILRAARALNRALAGRVVTRFDSVYPAVTRVADDHPVVGRTVESVSARGKHLLMVFSGNLVLRTHMRMNGSWHLYRTGARWQRPAHEMRVLVATADAVAIGFNVPVAELLSSQQLDRQKEIRTIGPDLLAGAGEHYEYSVDTVEIVRRMRAQERDAVADVLINQRVVAGIGNVFKSEILFVARIAPFTSVASLSDADLERIVGIARNQLAAAVLDPEKTLTRSIGRRTTRSLDPSARLWVYGRSGKPCRQCGSLIRSRKTGLDARLTYWCPRCQSTATSPNVSHFP
jgi:endonuclease-8